MYIHIETTKEELDRLYHKEKLSTRKLAKRFNLANHTPILRLMNEWGIPRRKSTFPSNVLKSRIEIDNLTTQELAYIAGIIDGEGCISIKDNQMDQFISIGNTSKELIDWLAFIFKVKISITEPNMITHKKPFYHIRVYRIADIIVLLRAIIPYLIIKKDVAMVGLNIMRTKYKDVLISGHGQL